MNAREVDRYVKEKDTVITTNVRSDVLYIEYNESTKESSINSIKGVGVVDSVLFDNVGSGIIVKINTLRPNIEEIKKLSGVKKVANVIDGDQPGDLLIPTGEIIIKPKAGVENETVLDELEKNGVKVVSIKESLSDVLVVELDAELNNVLDIANELQKNDKFEWVEANFIALIYQSGQYITSIRGQNQKQNANSTMGFSIRQNAQILQITIHNSNTRHLRVALYNLAGRRQKVSPVYHTDGVITVPLKNVATGSYIIRMYDGKNKWERRLSVI